MVLPSINAATSQGKSLALIRPVKTRFYYKRKSAAEIEKEREAFRLAARQTSLLDKELSELNPTPYQFRFKFQDDSEHDFENGDWEAHAMFFKACIRGKSHQEALDWMDSVFNEDYPSRGMLFAVGNQLKRPQTWQLLGVIRVDESRQASLDL